nr:MAG TPA: hypothetical protein [Caudoviricetes sp.]
MIDRYKPIYYALFHLSIPYNSALAYLIIRIFFLRWYKPSTTQLR